MRVALVGLGAMGLPVAQRIAAAGGQLTLFDLDPDRLRHAAGLGRIASSLPDATREADAVLTVLPADRHVRSVAAELAAVARSGQWLVELSTISPSTIDAVAVQLAAVGMQTVSAAITRGTAAARSGQLALFVGSKGPLPDDLVDLLGTIATDIRLVGPPGAAKALKIANNMVLACLDVVMGEHIVLAERLGIPAEALVDHLQASQADSWALQHHIRAHVLTDDLGPGHFSTVNMAKDVRLYVELAADLGRPAHLAGTALSSYRGVIASGLGEHYHPVVVRWLRAAAGLPAEGPRPGGTPGVAGVPPGADVHLASMGGAVRALQALASSDALCLLGDLGTDPLVAAEHLAGGSAGNDALQTVAERLDRAAPVDQDGLLNDLREALDLADVANVPLATTEAGRHVALSPSVAGGRRDAPVAGRRHQGAPLGDG